MKSSRPNQPIESPREISIDWNAALAEHRVWMRTVACSRLGERHAADDVLQEVAMLVLQHDSPPTEPQKVAPWLYRITLRQTINWRRRSGRQRRLVERFAARADAQPTPEPNPRDPSRRCGRSTGGRQCRTRSGGRRRPHTRRSLRPACRRRTNGCRGGKLQLKARTGGRSSV